MPDAYVIEVFGRTAGIVARDSQSNSFNFFSAAPRPAFFRPSGSRARGADACPIWELPAAQRNGIFPPKH
jgi:hypothetical protein